MQQEHPEWVVCFVLFVLYTVHFTRTWSTDVYYSSCASVIGKGGRASNMCSTNHPITLYNLNPLQPSASAQNPGLVPCNQCEIWVGGERFRPRSSGDGIENCRGQQSRDSKEPTEDCEGVQSAPHLSEASARAAACWAFRVAASDFACSISSFLVLSSLSRSCKSKVPPRMVRLAWSTARHGLAMPDNRTEGDPPH